MLMSSQNITLLLYPVMSKCGYPVSAYSNTFKFQTLCQIGKQCRSNVSV